MTTTRSSRSIASPVAARTASIILISGTCSLSFAAASSGGFVPPPGRDRERSGPPSPCRGGEIRLGLGRGFISSLEVRDFVLGGRQERDGRAHAGATLLPAQRAARDLFRLPRAPAQPHGAGRGGGVVLAGCRG